MEVNLSKRYGDYISKSFILECPKFQCKMSKFLHLDFLVMTRVEVDAENISDQH